MVAKQGWIISQLKMENMKIRDALKTVVTQTHTHKTTTKNPWPLFSKRNIPTERPPPVGEIFSANFKFTIL
jgi:hypothetical protein